MLIHNVLNKGGGANLKNIKLVQDRTKNYDLKL